MSKHKLNRIYTIATIVAVLATIVAVIASSILASSYFRGSSTSFNESLIGIGAALIGVFGGIIVTGLVIYVTYKREMILKQETILEQPYEQDQKEELIRLSQKGLELEKQRTNLEKQNKIMVWIFAAIEKAEDDPRLAFIMIYQGLETEVYSLKSRQFSDDTSSDADKQTINLSYDFDFLAKYVTPEQARTILQMRDLRNRVVHGEVGPEEITPEKVKEYLQEALHLAQVISRIKQEEEI